MRQEREELARLREIAILAGHMLDFVDEMGLGDWPSPMRLRHAMYPPAGSEPVE